MKKEIWVEDVTFAYDRDEIISKAHFHIEEGSFISFVGPNGGGKTTMVKLLLGLLQPSKGYIKIFGKSPTQARGEIGYVPQYTNFDLKFPINVLDVVLIGRLKKGKLYFNKKDKESAAEALEKVGLKDYGSRHFSQLSGGQRQRVLIARAIVSNPRVLILDEPTSNIDKVTENNLYKLLFELNKSMTIILISHDLTFVSENIHKVICIDREVRIHPTGKLERIDIDNLFGRGVKIVDHDTKMEESHE